MSIRWTLSVTVATAISFPAAAVAETIDLRDLLADDSEQTSIDVETAETGRRADDLYTVKAGDTLWGITSEHYRDPFLWPRIWRTNRAIANPDLIHPGDTIHFPTEEELLAAGIPGSALAPAQTANRPQEVVSRGEEAVAEPVTESRVEVAEQPAPTPAPLEAGAADRQTVDQSGYILSAASASGVVAAAPLERELLGERDRLYVLPTGTAQPALGDRFVLFREVKTVYHPVSGKNLGALIRVLGVGEVVAARPSEKMVTLRVVRSYDYISPGDRIMPYRELALTPASRPTPEVRGYIVESREQRAELGEDDIVYLDRGLADGLQVGDRFQLVRPGWRTATFSPGNGARVPEERLGQIRVISVQDRTAAARVTQSLDSVHVGDRFQPSFSER